MFNCFIKKDANCLIKEYENCECGGYTGCVIICTTTPKSIDGLSSRFQEIFSMVPRFKTNCTMIILLPPNISNMFS